MDKNIFSQKLVELRKFHKFKQREVAKNLGVSARVYSYWECNHFPDKFEQIISLCRIYNVDANELFGIKAVWEYPKLTKEFTYEYFFDKIVRALRYKAGESYTTEISQDNRFTILINEDRTYSLDVIGRDNKFNNVQDGANALLDYYNKKEKGEN